MVNAMKPLLVSESLPWSMNPEDAMLPWLAEGHFLMRMLKLNEEQYLAAFKRRPLCMGRELPEDRKMVTAYARALLSLHSKAPVIAVGQRVTRAVCEATGDYGNDLEDFGSMMARDGRWIYSLPALEPHGRVWRDPDSTQLCRELVAAARRRALALSMAGSIVSCLSG